MSNTEITYRPKYKVPKQELNFEEMLSRLTNRVDQLERVIKTDPVMDKPLTEVFPKDTHMRKKEVVEAVKKLGIPISSQVLDKEIDSGKLTGVQFGKSVFYREKDIKKWLENKENKNK